MAFQIYSSLQVILSCFLFILVKCVSVILN